MNSVLRIVANPQSPKAVLFDAVGTLIYADPPVGEVYHAAGRRHGSRLDAAEVAHRLRRAMRRRSESHQAATPPATDHESERQMWRDIVREIFDDVPHETSGRELFESLWQHFARSENWRLYRDVADTWRDLEGRGYLLGVASNFDDRLREVCRGLPPLDACQHLYWSARIGYPKPCREFFRRVERELGLSPGHMLLVGDDWINDIEGAREAGWSAAFLDRSGQAESPSGIATLAALPKLLAT